MNDKLALGPYVLDRPGRRLLRDGIDMPLGARAFDTLTALVAARGEVVGKGALLDAVWPGMVVEENNLQVQISALRRVLGDGWIANVPGRGYRLSVPAGHESKPPEIPSLVVLPFQNISDDPGQDYFADGLVEEITSALSRISGLLVIARSSAFTYKGRPIDVKQVGRDLDVRYVVEGSVRRTNSRVRVAAQLVDAASATHLWAERFEGTLDDIFDLQDRITEQIAGAIEPSFHSAEIRRSWAKSSTNLTAHDLYYRALHLMHCDTKEDLAQSVVLLRRAIAEESSFVLARALAARTICRGVLATWFPRDDAHLNEAILLAKSSLRDAPDDALVLAYAGFALAYLSEERGLGHAALEKAVSLNPNSPGVLLLGAAGALYTNRPAEAHERFQRGLRLTPRGTDHGRFLMGMALAAYDAGDPARGLAYARRNVEMDPKGHHSHGALIYCLVALGQIDEARAMAREMHERYPGETIAHNIRHLQVFTPEQRERRLHALRAAGLPA